MKLQQWITDYVFASVAIGTGIGFLIGWWFTDSVVFEQNWRIILAIFVPAFVVLAGLNYQRIKHLETEYKDHAQAIVDARAHLRFYISGGCFDRNYESSTAFDDFTRNISSILPVAEHRAGPRLVVDAVPFATTRNYVEAAARGAPNMRDKAWRLFKWTDACIAQGKFGKYQKRYSARPKNHFDN